MEVDEDYSFDNQGGIEELGMEALEDGAFVGSDDLVDYSSGEDEHEDEIGYIKAEECIEESIPRTMITGSNITVKRVVNSKPVATSVPKILPRPQTGFFRTTNAAGKVVVIQKLANSVHTPVKLLNNTRPSPATGNTTSYHLVKSEGGVVMRQKVLPQTMIRRVVPVTSAAEPNKAKVCVKAPTHVVIQTKSGTGSGTTTKTVTVAEAHQMGLLNSNKMKQMVTMAKPRPAGPFATKSPAKILPSTSSGSSMVRLKQSPGAPGAAGQTQKVLIKANQAAGTKTAVHSQKVLLPQSAIQAGQQSGQIQAINIPGKGIQYVRFLNQNSGSTAGSAQKVVQVQVNKAAGAAPPGSKIIVQNNKTYVVSNGNVTAVRTASNQQNIRTLASGSPLVRKTIASTGAGLIRKDPESNRYIAVVKKEDINSTETVTTLTASQLSQLKGTTVMAGGAKTKIVMLPSDYNRQVKPSSSSAGTSIATTVMSNPPSIISVKRESISGSDDEARKGPSIGTAFPDEAYKKRPCNCTKSQCLKLYCDCFANGEFCYNCNCRDCYNNLDNEEERQKAIRATLERNPCAFKPKIGAVSAAEDALRQHTKGCNCKRSGCLKNYCECYEAKIPCSGNCKCIGCRNTEQYAKEYEYATGGVLGAGGASGGCGLDLGLAGDLELNLSGDDSMAEGSSSLAAGTSLSVPGPSGATGGTAVTGDNSLSLVAVGVKRTLPAEPDLTQLPPSKQPYNFMTPDVIEATVQCMIAQADECQKRGCNIRTAERMILEEFGRCLVEIIDFSTKSDS